MIDITDFRNGAKADIENLKCDLRRGAETAIQRYGIEDTIKWDWRIALNFRFIITIFMPYIMNSFGRELDIWFAD